MVDTAVPQRVWSAAFYRCVARLFAVGLLTGAGAGVALVLLTSLPSFADGAVYSFEDLSDLVGLALLGATVGGACAVPTVVLSAATGLVVAARSPQRRGVALGLLLLWPLAVTATAAGVWFRGVVRDGVVETVLSGAVLVALVAVAVFRTRRWVLAPLRGSAPSA